MKWTRPQYVRVGNLVVHLPSIRAVGLRHIRVREEDVEPAWSRPTLFVVYPKKAEVVTEFATAEEAKAALDTVTSLLVPPRLSVDGREAMSGVFEELLTALMLEMQIPQTASPDEVDRTASEWRRRFDAAAKVTR